MSTSSAQESSDSFEENEDQFLNELVCVLKFQQSAVLAAL